ncbi:RNA polymerase sigma-54 factor, partial [Candidatus Poribacteria bacterium]|nr:RNA polymerase sigma-54 factor [Candidatus Poribacteria bacterium]
MHIGLKQTPTQQLQQRLIMTPKLQQAIKVLLMSRIDLAQYVTQQLEQNIFLDDMQEELDIDELSEMETLDPDAEWNEPQE